MTKPDQHSAALLALSLRMIAGVVLLTALGVAPLNFGSTRRVPLETLIALVATGGVTWLLSVGLARSWQRPPAPTWIGAALLGGSAVAWGLWLTPPSLPEFTREHFSRIAARWPSSVVPRDFAITLAWTISTVLALFALMDFARDAAWRQAIAVVMLMAGAAVAVLGLLQNATSARGIYWESSQRMPGAFFGTFFHHTAAGSYLNSVWPLGVGLLLKGLQRPFRTPRARLPVYGAMAAVILIFAAHAGHISRFPQAIATVVLLGLLIWTRPWHLVRRFAGLRIAMFAGVAFVFAAVILAGATRFGTITARWQQLRAEKSPAASVVVVPPPVSEWPKRMRDDLFIPSDHRAYVLGDRGANYAAARAAIAERPWFGWGPGGWMAAAAAHSVDPFVRTFYLTLQFTHSDFLQTCVEWGLIGATGWILLVPAAAIFGFVKLRAHPEIDYIGAVASAGLLAVVIQALIDFPLQIPAAALNATALAALAWSVPASSVRLTTT